MRVQSLRAARGAALSVLAGGALLLSGCMSSSSSSSKTDPADEITGTQTAFTTESAPDMVRESFVALEDVLDAMGGISEMIGAVMDEYEGICESGSVSYSKSGQKVTATFSSCKMDEEDGAVRVSGKATFEEVDATGDYDNAYRITLDLSHSEVGDDGSGTIKGSYRLDAVEPVDDDAPPAEAKAVFSSLLTTWSDGENEERLALKDTTLIVEHTGSALSALKIDGKLGFELTKAGETLEAAFLVEGAIEEFTAGDEWDLPQSGTLTLSDDNGVDLVVDFKGDDVDPKQVVVTLDGEEIFPGDTSYPDSYEGFESWMQGN